MPSTVESSLTRNVRVFVNATAIDVPAGSTALDAVRAWRAEAAADVSGGVRVITDSRGLPIDGETLVSAGSIFRVIANRDRTSESDELT